MNQKKTLPLFMLLILTLSGGWMMNVYLSPPDFAAYYSHAHTIFHDIDLDFRNEYEHFGFEKHMFYVTPAGHLSNDWPMGTGMVWSPFFLCGLALEKAGGGKGGLSSSCFAAVAVGILF
ncbi:MAG TPA: hypothetical protein PLB62_16830, partial [Candidatus Sumerlaeota bacterium]|nr:hypothetical protein [Candidatus Sumerlaeota bacterium]